MSGLGRYLHIALVISLFASTGNLWAQATAQISGTAKDQSGAVLPGVEIRATQADTGIARTTVTNETGSYVLPNLAIGPYRLEASLPGFRTYVQMGIVLQVDSNPVVNVTLTVGQVAETIEVQANAALVETRSTSVGQVVENTRILELPLNGRQAVELIGLAGAAAPAPNTDSGGRDPFNKFAFSVAGGLNTGVSFTLDGAFHMNPQGNGYMSTPFPDALQEFKVETSATAAASGGKSAGSVSLVTKSGTNDFHGDLFEFVRNGIFNARNSFALRRDTLKRNQFGGTIGGPVLKNKLFFFSGYQGTTIRSDPTSLISTVPTPAMLAGDFTAIASPACNGGKQIALKAPFVNGGSSPGGTVYTINPALSFSKAALKLASKLPQATNSCGTVIYGNPQSENGHMTIGRLDYQHSAKHTIFGRYLMEHLVDPAPFDLDHNVLSMNGASTPRIDAMSQAFTIGSTYLISSSVVNSLRLTANRIAAGKFEPLDVSKAGLGFADLGVKAFSYEPYLVQIANVIGGFVMNTSAGSARIAVFGGNDDVSVIRGSHEMVFGANTEAWWVNSYSNQYFGRFTFNGNNTGLGLADFLTGQASQFINGGSAGQNKRQEYLAVYANDTWKFRPRLTINYGLRWQPYFPMVNLDGSSVHFDENALKNGIKSTRFDHSPPGLFFDGDPGFPNGTGTYGHWTNFAPRAGLAWDVTGDGKTSLRASGGMFYDFPNAYYMVSLTSSAPWNPRYTLTGNVNFDNPWSNTPGGDPFPLPQGRSVARNTPWPNFALATAMNYDLRNMEVGQWNLSLQRQISNQWLVSANYLGTKTSHMWTLQQLNPTVFLGFEPCNLGGVQYATCSATTNNDARRRLNLTYPGVGQLYGDLPRIAAEGNANYNGLLLTVQRNARNVTLNANYTLSHCISDHPQPTQNAFGTNGNIGWTNNDRHTDHGDCAVSSQDRRHIFNLSAVAATPVFTNPVLRPAASNWRVSPILKVFSGEAMTVVTSVDRALTNQFLQWPALNGGGGGIISGQRVNQVLGNPYGDGTPAHFFNPAAFAQPALGTALPNSGMGNVRGPGFWQFDLSLSRTFPVREMQKVEFRAEAFNILNKFIMMEPTYDINSNLFGRVTQARDPRIMQFALKYLF
jgi:hypothetical protein